MGRVTKQERVKLIEDAIEALSSALVFEQTDYPALHAKSRVNDAEKLIESWKEAHKFAKLNGKWL